MKGISSTKGHLSNNGGLRGHSVDSSVFPYVIVAQSCPTLGTWWRIRFPDGNYSYKVSASAHSAEVDARALKSGLITQMTEIEFAHSGGYQQRPELVPLILSEYASAIAWHFTELEKYKEREHV